MSEFQKPSEEVVHSSPFLREIPTQHLCNQGSSSLWNIQIRKLLIFPEKVREIQVLLRWLQEYEPSSHIVSFCSIMLTPLYLCAIADPVAMESWGEASEYIPLKRGVKENEAKEVVQELLLAILDIHNRGMAHGHINLGNIRRHRSSGRVVILEHIFPVTLFVPSTSYASNIFSCAAPEVKKREPFGYAADVWSVGVILHELIVPDKAFLTEDVVGTDLLSPFLVGLDELTQSFLMLCLKLEPSERPTLAELVLHPFLTNTFSFSLTEKSKRSLDFSGEETDEESDSEWSESTTERVNERSSSEESEGFSESSEYESEVKYVRL